MKKQVVVEITGTQREVKEVIEMIRSIDGVRTANVELISEDRSWVLDFEKEMK